MFEQNEYDDDKKLLTLKIDGKSVLVRMEGLVGRSRSFFTQVLQEVSSEDAGLKGTVQSALARFRMTHCPFT